ncbi:class I SAM-dependent methyltransferase [Chloroflexota bacterium]
MSFTGKFIKAYFNNVYNQVYDSTTARLSSYFRLQQRCISKLKFKDGESVLCIGLGTGNEIAHVFKANKNVSITGVDYSRRALITAYQKALDLGKEIRVVVMDAQQMEFEAATFDKVICLHVMDFIKDPKMATGEIFRVLKDGGQFVVTYPSHVEDVRMARSLIKDNINHNSGLWKSRVRAFHGLLSLIPTCFVYLPLFSRPGKVHYNNSELQKFITELASVHFQIEEDPIYHNYIVHGYKG